MVKIKCENSPHVGFCSYGSHSIFLKLLCPPFNVWSFSFQLHPQKSKLIFYFLCNHHILQISRVNNQFHDILVQNMKDTIYSSINFNTFTHEFPSVRDLEFILCMWTVLIVFLSDITMYEILYQCLAPLLLCCAT